MSGLVAWIRAESDADPKRGTLKARELIEKRALGGSCSSEIASNGLPARDFPGWEKLAEGLGDALDRNPDLWLYRDRTVGLLRRYMRISLETGRFPTIIGREFFRAKVSFYRAATFEDRVIFVRDMEKCLSRLEYWDQQLIARVVLQEHNQEQAAYLLHCSRKRIVRRLPEVLDLLSEDFLRTGLLMELPAGKNERQ
jgi:hypothetical protein